MDAQAFAAPKGLRPRRRIKPAHDDCLFVGQLRSPAPRHARPCAGHPRLCWRKKAWMAGTSPAMTTVVSNGR